MKIEEKSVKILSKFSSSLMLSINFFLSQIFSILSQWIALRDGWYWVNVLTMNSRYILYSTSEREKSGWLECCMGRKNRNLEANKKEKRKKLIFTKQKSSFLLQSEIRNLFNK